MKFGGIYAPNRIYSTGSFRFYTSFPYTSSDIIMVIGTITDYNNPSTGEIIYMSLNTQGLTIKGYLNISGTTTLNNATSCISSLNVSDTTTLSNNTTCISSLNVSGTPNLNNARTCISSLNVSGVTTLLNDVTFKGELINQY